MEDNFYKDRTKKELYALKRQYEREKYKITQKYYDEIAPFDEAIDAITVELERRTKVKLQSLMKEIEDEINGRG